MFARYGPVLHFREQAKVMHMVDQSMPYNNPLGMVEVALKKRQDVQPVASTVTRFFL